MLRMRGFHPIGKVALVDLISMNLKLHPTIKPKQVVYVKGTVVDKTNKIPLQCTCEFDQS